MTLTSGETIPTSGTMEMSPTDDDGPAATDQRGGRFRVNSSRAAQLLRLRTPDLDSAALPVPQPHGAASPSIANIFSTSSHAMDITRYPEAFGPYRYRLTVEISDPNHKPNAGHLAVVMLNPATIHEDQDLIVKPNGTRKNLIRLAQQNGYHTLTELDLFAYRSPDRTSLNRAIRQLRIDPSTRSVRTTTAPYPRWSRRPTESSAPGAGFPTNPHSPNVLPKWNSC